MSALPLCLVKNAVLYIYTGADGDRTDQNRKESREDGRRLFILYLRLTDTFFIYCAFGF